ncbi:luciferase family oxidoreductase, group 1 [Sphingomonas laterariae]|uniref:Luciferase family oxidoreductase, group 1 n=1 Tax=Edaphosphingomonas laterariae TaxID=861865 RepID=A0A239JA45_9SPHN|nr:MsnO8 family LLM class oxidoreductase [Sphingomonas laterariae]SNT01524.1 luciferase family oxidoreductase, group 1 [Sphingomonas laterariae]
MKLSIVDLSTIKPGETASDALAQSLETARNADALGYHRIWFAEHHMAPAQASHHPELLIAAAGTQTRRIRLGSGAVLMNHYSPFKVAEMFKQLEAMFPGRVDLGMGRATAGPVIDMAMRRHRDAQPVDDHAAQVSETVAWLHQAFPAGHPFAGKPLIPTVASVPESWLLGSSPGGARLAAQIGIGYSFAGFINPQAAALALRGYREAFVATPFASGAPRAMLGVNVCVGEDGEHGRRLALSVKGYYQRLTRIGATAFVPTIAEAEAELGAAERDEPTQIIGGRWPRFVAGSAEEVRQTLEQMIAQSGADELIVQDMMADPQDRRGSHARLAKAFGLSGETPS